MCDLSISTDQPNDNIFTKEWYYVMIICELTSTYVVCLNFGTQKSVPKDITRSKTSNYTRHCFKICLLRIANTTESLVFYFIFATFDNICKKEKNGRPPNWRNRVWALNIRCFSFTWPDMLFSICTEIPSQHLLISGLPTFLKVVYLY